MQRVNKAFQATILGSTRVQHKMFLRIRNKVEAPWTYRRNGLQDPRFEQVPEFVRDEVGRMCRLIQPVDRAMAVRANASLYTDHRDKSIETKIFRNITANEIINKLQHEYKCSTILCRSSFVTLDDVLVPSEQQWAEVNAAYAKRMQRTD